jgi:hypothetical protein
LSIFASVDLRLVFGLTFEECRQSKEIMRVLSESLTPETDMNVFGNISPIYKILSFVSLLLLMGGSLLAATTIESIGCDRGEVPRFETVEYRLDVFGLDGDPFDQRHIYIHPHR